VLRRLTIANWDRLVPLSLIGVGAAVTALAFAADLLRIGDQSGIGPNQFSVALSGFAILVAGFVLVSPVGLRPVAEWLLIGVAVVAATFAADLLVLNGLPGWPAKLAVLASTGVSVLSLSAVATGSWGRWKIRSLLQQVSLDRLSVGAFGSIVVQLSLIALVVRQFRLETQALYHNVMLLILCGFLIHYLLPGRYRLSYFLLLSLAALAGILGLVNSIWLLAIGLGLVGIAHLPISHELRVVVLLAAGILLAVIRGGWIEATWLEVIWPILASMFMFRLIVYMYDLKHGKARPTLASTLSYFFLLPNVVFPFFPIVDYGTFRRTYYDDEQHAIYQKGLRWILRGIVHLLLYRYINYYVMLSPQEVTNATELVRYLVANFALYVRISGQFHLIIGLLHLFGFNLPETHHLYFLASSFTDMWRRMNIYWKDFMLKVFYYPVYFRIRQWGPTTSMVLATTIVFFLTWFLHAYQWFWLRGSFLLTAQDVLFWLTLTLLIIANMLYEARRGRDRSLGQRSLSFGSTFALALRTAGMFSVMAVLWSLWGSDSVGDWISLLSVVQFTPGDVSILVFAFLGLTAVMGVAIWFSARGEVGASPKREQAPLGRTFAATGVPLLFLLLLGQPSVQGRLGGQAQVVLADLTENRLSDREAVLLQRGYYEDLVGVDRFNSQLWEIYTKRPSDWPSIMETEVARQTGDNLIVELVPSTTINFQGAQLSTNRWGMRDRDYELIPPADTYRIALTGPSFVMGSGVANDEVFESLLEDRLNREHGGGSYASYEILNLAVPGYSALQELMVLEQKGLSFQPDALFFIAHQREEEDTVRYLADRMSAGAELAYADLMELAQQAGVEAGATMVESERRLKPFGSEILAWTYRRIAETSRANGVLPVWIFVPTLENPVREEIVEHLAFLAEESGFIVLDLSDAYDQQDLESLVVAYWDKHPNAAGHRLLAEKLYQALLEREDTIPLSRASEES
jgi:D-alanyl-lipoteichoic acid acyltransferase DltB (MBOAT superfamily)